jgi:hypothetical protein
MSSSTLIMAGLSEEAISLGSSTLIIDADASMFLRPVKNTSSFDNASSTDCISLTFASLAPLEIGT